MARYVDVDGCRKLFDEKIRKLIAEGETHLDNLAEGFSEASRVIDRMPTTDVAPRSEVAREIFEEIEEFAELQIEALNIAEKVDASGTDFFGGGKQAFCRLLEHLAELKKKYTESTAEK